MMDKIKSMFVAFKADMGDTWKRLKIVVIAIGAILVAIEFGKIRDFIISFMGKRELKQADKKDENLKKEESDLNTKANKIIADADALPSQEKPVGLDWNKEKK